MADEYADWQSFTGAERLARLRGRLAYLQTSFSADMTSGDQSVRFQFVQAEIARLSEEEQRLDGLSALESGGTAPGGRSKMVFRAPDA